MLSDEKQGVVQGAVIAPLDDTLEMVRLRKAELLLADARAELSRLMALRKSRVGGFGRE